MRSGAVAIAALVVVSVVASSAVPLAAQPSGFTPVPDANIEATDGPINGVAVADLEGAVYASDGADTLNVTLTTVATGFETVGDKKVYGSNEKPALLLTDNQTHTARTVAIEAAVFEELAPRDSPPLIYGYHENGSTWTAPVRYENGYAKIEVPAFSTNVISFVSEVSITSSTARDGATITYDVENLDTVSDPVVNFTGTSVLEWDNESTTQLGDGDAMNLEIAGNADPSGPAGGEPQVVVRFNDAPPVRGNDWGSKSDEAKQFGGGQDAEYYLPDVQGDALKGIILSGSGTSDLGGIDVQVYVATGERPDGTIAEGTTVFDSFQEFGASAYLSDGDNVTIRFPEPISIPNDATIAVESKGKISGVLWNVSLDSESDGATEFYGSGPTGSTDQNPSIYELPAGVENVDVTADTGASAAIGTVSAGSPATAALDLSTGTSQLKLAMSAGSVNVTVRMQEQTETVDPAVRINGQWVNHTGSLNDGETVEIIADSDAIQQGENKLTVAVGDGSLSSDAPTPAVELAFTHTAGDNQTIDYGARWFEEQYEVSRTFASTRETATLTVPFEGDVVGIDLLEYRINGSTWRTVGQADYTLKDTTLKVDLIGVYGGQIPAQTTIDVRVEGTRMDARDMSIQVLSVSDRSERLDSEIKITSVSGSDPRIRVPYDRLIGVDGQADPYLAIEQNQSHYLHLPNAAAGEQVRVRSVPIEVETNGRLELSITSFSASSPEWEADPGASIDSVTYTYLDGQTGRVYSLTRNDRIVANKTASSPVSFEANDSGTYQIVPQGGAGFLQQAGSSSSGFGGLVLIGGIVAAIAVLVFITRRVGGGDDVPVVGGALETLGGESGSSLILLVGVGAVLLVVAIWQGALNIAIGPEPLSILAVVGGAALWFGVLSGSGRFSTELWLAGSALGAVVALESVGGPTVSQLVGSPTFPIIAIVGVYAAYRFLGGGGGGESGPEIVIEGESQ